MQESLHPERTLPGRGQALLFAFKSSVLKWRRMLMDFDEPVRRHLPGDHHGDWKVVAEKRSALWNHDSAEEFPLTAGKIENLRVAAERLHRVAVPAGAVWSFWKQLGRATRGRGFVNGRELREGCLVPAIGGGLCQLSGLIYQAALDAGLEVIERHGHTRVIPGSLAEQDMDATVFWNYVDLRFAGGSDWAMEVELTPSDLVVRIRSCGDQSPIEAKPTIPRELEPASGDCLTCGMVECFRHPSAVSENAPSLGHSSYLLDARWPEFDQWCADHSREGDRWFTPLDGAKWRKPNYRWNPPKGTRASHSTLATLLRSQRQRSIPQQGALRQRALLKGSEDLARSYAAKLDPLCRHVVVSQNLLPYLWRMGALGGRTFDVLVERWPMEELQRRLDEALAAHPDSPTLGDFRVDEQLARDEAQALAAAGRLITPHRAMADHFGSRAWLVDWEMPEAVKRKPSTKPTILLPCSRLGRKGAYELAEAFRELDGVELKFLGAADEGPSDPFDGVACSKATPHDLAQAHLLVMPAWVEHQPRMALKALTSGIPVIATKACGLPEHPHLYQLDQPDAKALVRVMRSVLASY